MEEKLASLLAALGAAQTFEEAARIVLQALLSEAQATLARSTFAGRGRVLRGMLHLRPAGGYRGLVVEEFQKSARGVPLFPSATAWRLVTERRAAVEIDVGLGILRVVTSSVPEEYEESPGASFDSKESRARLLEREATHVLALPLRMPGGAIGGMISIEVLCRSAMGKPFLWSEYLPTSESLVNIAAPYLAALPGPVVGGTSTDELLPVIGASMVGVVEMLRVFAKQDETIVLSGPTGAGKSRFARWCHAQSPQHAAAFETLDLSTVPEELQMAELFGWKRGAFTGALKDTPGCLARAEGGTLFIDEIDKLSLKVQAGLLRVLEERRYRPLGDSAGDRSAEVRFVIGTNANLSEAVRAGQFREDLYYRLNVLPVKIPPLDERRDEIPLWAEYMLERRRQAAGAGSPIRLSSEAARVLVGRYWPGNLRQLDNIVRRAYALSLMEPTQNNERTISASLIERALAYESGAGPASLLDLMLAVAVAFVAEAERRQSQGVVFDLDHADALRGFILGVSVQKTGSREEAYRLFGKDALIETRNHQKALKREAEKVAALCHELAQPEKSPFSRQGE